MTCVGYDERFVRNLEANAHRFVPSVPKKTVGGRKGSNKTKGRRKTERTEELAEHDESDDEQESSSREDHVVAAERRSTRPRVKRVRIS